jgi:hypothetical protein
VNNIKKLIVLAVIGWFVFAAPAYASEQCVDVDGHWTQGEWVDTTYKCPDGLVEGDNGMCHEWIVSTERVDTHYICPTGYHLHNEKPWAVKCRQYLHQDRAPVCPTGYDFIFYVNECSKIIDHSHWSADVEKVVDVDGHYSENVWVETTYKDCNYDREVQCPTECGQPASEVANGEGGVKVCDATPACKTPKGNTFHRDTRCHATTPATPQWAIRLPIQGGIMAQWSAIGGSKVDIEVTNAKGEYEYKYYGLQNDGHEVLPNVSMSQQYRIRVVNECRKSDWLIDY